MNFLGNSPHMECTVSFYINEDDITKLFEDVTEDLYYGCGNPFPIFHNTSDNGRNIIHYLMCKD